MAKKHHLKRKLFTLIEVVIALFLVSIIAVQGVNLLSHQIKNQAKIKKAVTKFISKKSIYSQIHTIFFHLNPKNKNCLAINDDKVKIYFDAGSTLNPNLSGCVEGELVLKKEILWLIIENKQGPSSHIAIADDVKMYKLSVYSQEFGWQNEWESKQQGLPEMVHLRLTTSAYDIDQKFLLPYNLKPIEIACKSSHLSFL